MEELNAVQNEKLMDETIKHELERIKNLTPGSDEYKAAYECAAKFYEIRVKTFGTAWLPETAKDIGETILQYAEEGMANG